MVSASLFVAIFGLAASASALKPPPPPKVTAPHAAPTTSAAAASTGPAAAELAAGAQLAAAKAAARPGAAFIGPPAPRGTPGLSPAEAYRDFKIAPKLPTSKDERQATVLTYLMTDDETHQSPHSQRMLKMFDKLPQDGVHNVVFRDGNRFGDSRLYYMRDGKAGGDGMRAAESLLAPHVSEVQSNNPKVFSEIIRWTFDNYAGKRKYLEIYTHGGARPVSVPTRVPSTRRGGA